MRPTMIRLHRWIGLFTGPVILVLGLSGAVLVYREELGAALDGRPPAVEPAASTVSLDAAIAGALVRFPGAEPRAIVLAPSARQPHRIELQWRGDRVEVWVDPYRGTVLGSRLPDRSVLVAVHRLHAHLHLGRAGSAIVGVLGLLLLVEGMTGLWLWPPSTWRRRAPRFGRRPRADAAHRLLGALTLAVNGLLGLTGALLAFAAVTGGPPDGLPARLHALALLLHSGGIGGEPARLTWALMGLTLPILVVSGYLLAGAAARLRSRGPQNTR
jgi:uncharacterized iron-regulated membrane protein